MAETTKRKRKRAPRSRRAGCLRLLAVLIVTPLFLCACGVVGMHVYISFPVQRVIYGLKQNTNPALWAAKESDMIALSCWKGIYTLYPDGSNLRNIHHGYIIGYRSELPWSADGIWLAAPLHGLTEWRQGEVFNMRFDGSSSRRLTFNYTEDEHVHWSPDDRGLYYVNADRMYWVSADGREMRELKELWRIGRSLSPVAWSPDGEWLVYEVHSYRDNLTEVRFRNYGGAGSNFELQVKDKVDDIVWAPDSDRVALETDDLMYVYSLKNESYDFEIKLNVVRAAWSPNGRWMALQIYNPGAETRNLKLFDTLNGDIQPLFDGAGFSPTWSPDNEWIAFTSGVEDRQLFKIRRDGRDLQQLTDLDCDIKVASWSPR